MESKEEMEGKCKTIIVLGQRAEPSTPSTAWTLHFSSLNSTVSARKLCANLWEFLPQITTPQPISNKKKKKKKKKKGFQLQNHLYLPRQPAIASSSRTHVADTLVEHHKSVNRNTSSELLNAFDRIRILEEKQSRFVSSLKSLKAELNLSHSQIKELLKEKPSYRKKKVAENKVTNKNKEHGQDQVEGLIRSTQADLEGEWKSRKLGRELSNVKSGFSNALKELERERKARILLENLCDEFAKGITDYEQEVRSLRHKPDMDHVGRRKPDPLILHISEAWLDERMQMGLSESKQNDLTGKNTIVDNLSVDIETFLQARHSDGSQKNRSSLNEAINYSRRESFPLSAHQDAPNGEDSIDFERENGKGYMLNGSCSQFNSNDRKLNSLNRNESVSSECDKIHPEDNINADTCVDPKQAKLKSKLTSPEIRESESSRPLPSGVKENTLKAKLMEARLESRKYRAITSGSSSHM